MILPSDFGVYIQRKLKHDLKEISALSCSLLYYSQCHCCSVAQSCLTVTPWTAAHQASLSITNYQSLLKLMSIESVMPSNHIILCCPLLLLPSIFPSIRVFSNELTLHIMWPKYWSFSFNISPSNKYSVLISLRLTGLFSLLCKGLSRAFSSITVQRHQFFGAPPALQSSSHNHVTTGKTIALTIWTFVSRAMSLLFNTLSKFVIAFLPRSNRLLAL